MRSGRLVPEVRRAAPGSRVFIDDVQVRYDPAYGGPFRPEGARIFLHSAREPDERCGSEEDRRESVFHPLLYFQCLAQYLTNNKSESPSVVFNSLQPHGLYSPWNSLGQNTGVSNLPLFQRIFLTQALNRGLLHCFCIAGLPWWLRW